MTKMKLLKFITFPDAGTLTLPPPIGVAIGLFRKPASSGLAPPINSPLDSG